MQLITMMNLNIGFEFNEDDINSDEWQRALKYLQCAVSQRKKAENGNYIPEKIFFQ